MKNNTLLVLFAFILPFISIGQTNHDVEVSSNVFTPADITIELGDTVTWTNVSGVHNVDGRQMSYPGNPASFYSGPAGDGWTFSHVFDVPGFYDYECNPHTGMGMTGTVMVNEPQASDANVQIVHNSPSPDVDIWLNGDTLLTVFSYRTATEYLEVPAGVELNVGVAPAGSNSVEDTLANFTFTLDTGVNYQIIANGIVGDSITPFNLEVIAPARQSAENGGVDLAVFHGSPDAPAVDVFARDVAQIVEDLAFAESSDYINVPADVYTLDIKATGTEPIVASYEADLSGLEGGAGTVLASGFLAPDSTQPDFALLAVFPDGTVVDLPEVENTAQVQIIHNSPTPTVDIWVNDEPAITSFQFRTATSYLELPAGEEINIGIAPEGSTGPADYIADYDVLLEPNLNYQAIANGIVGDMETPFSLEIISDTRTSASENVDILAFHGSPNAPAVDINVRSSGTVVGDLEFGENSGYINIPAGTYVIDVRPAGSNTIVKSFLAPITGAEGAALTVMASGFVNPDTADPEFGLYAIAADGNILELPEVENTAELQLVHNSPSPTVDVWVNDERFLTDFEFRTATEYLEVPAGENLNVGVALAGSTSPDDILVDFDLVLQPNVNYQVFANGIVGDMDRPFSLEAIAPTRQAADSTGVDLAVFHGSPDASAVDVTAEDVGLLVQELSYAEAVGYINVPADEYTLIVDSWDPPATLASFVADISNRDGAAGTIFASGFVSPQGEEPSFGLFIVWPDGTVVELPIITSAPTAFEAELKLYPNPATDRAILQLDPGDELVEQTEVMIRDAGGQIVSRPFRGELNPGRNTIELPVDQLSKGMYLVEITSPEGVITRKLVVQ